MSGEFSVFWLLTGMIMLLPHFVCSLMIEKRSHFIIRTISGILVYAACAYFICFCDQQNELYYLLLHLVASAYLIWCCANNIRELIYLNIWCIVLYYFVFQVNALVNYLFHTYEQQDIEWVTRMFFIPVCLVCMEVFIFRSLMKKDMLLHLNDSQILISFLIGGSIIAFNTIFYRQLKHQGAILFIFQIFSMLCVILVMYMQVVSVYGQRKTLEANYIQHMWREKKKDLELKTDYIDLINHKYHDLKHELRAIRQMSGVQRSSYLDKLESDIDQYQNLFQTGNEYLDVILNETRRQCEKDNIRFSCVVNCGNLDFINVVDLNVLLGNLLDNAVEATVTLPKVQRVLDFRMHSDHHYLRITEKNTFSGAVTLNAETLKSSKPENDYHGFGYQSMKYVVERYHGQMVFDTAGNIFTIHIIIPLPSDRI